MAGRACWCWAADALPLAVALFLLPESVRYLVAAPGAAHCCYPAPYRAAAEGSGICTTRSRPGEREIRDRRHFLPRYAVGTVMLCLTCFMGLLIFYLLTSWLPLLIRETGASMSQASIITALFRSAAGLAC